MHENHHSSEFGHLTMDCMQSSGRIHLVAVKAATDGTDGAWQMLCGLGGFLLIVCSGWGMSNRFLLGGGLTSTVARRRP
jgi:hypothetical protein